MPASKIAVTVDERVLAEVERWVREGRYPNRSRAVQAALEEKLRRDRRRRLVDEAGKLDPAEERALAEEGMGGEKWPEY
ncbi:MAG: ribbon-helix-helix domain-containing protein [Armatimonadota bacterium]